MNGWNLLRFLIKEQTIEKIIFHETIWWNVILTNDDINKIILIYFRYANEIAHTFFKPLLFRNTFEKYLPMEKILCQDCFRIIWDEGDK